GRLDSRAPVLLAPPSSTPPAAACAAADAAARASVSRLCHGPGERRLVDARRRALRAWPEGTALAACLHATNGVVWRVISGSAALHTQRSMPAALASPAACSLQQRRSPFAPFAHNGPFTLHCIRWLAAQLDVSLTQLGTTSSTLVRHPCSQPSTQTTREPSPRLTAALLDWGALPWPQSRTHHAQLLRPPEQTLLHAQYEA
ncbi:hypothetical protein SVAN01_07876, partial [Stagonosporopsis vannaccii]